MKKSWIALLYDPFDKSKLKPLTVKKVGKNGDIINGQLISASGNTYPIKNGVGVFLSKSFQNESSVESFAYEWEKFGFLFAQKNWVNDLIVPLVGGVDFFRNKIIIDAGSGSGAQSRWMAEAGAKLVFSLELSNAIFTAHPRSVGKYKNKIVPLQGDIAHPPIKIIPDVIYCINVMQHTENPQETLKALANLMDMKTVFLFNIYDVAKNPPSRRIIINFVRKLTRYLPFSIWRGISFLIILFLYACRKIPIISQGIQRIYPLGDSFKGDWLNLYDLAGGHYYQDFYTEQEQRNMIVNAGLKIRKKTHFGYVLRKK